MANNQRNSLSVLVTRPHSQAVSLCQALETRGFHVFQAPVMEIVPLADAAQIQHITQCFSAMDQYAGIIVVSVNAAEQALAWFRRYPPAPDAAFFAVGETTANFLRQHLPAGSQREVIYPRQQMDSEGLLALPQLQASQVSGKTFLLLRGVGGRETIATTLRARGAKVRACELYERTCPPTGELLRQGIATADFMVVNSVESLANLLALAGAGFVAAHYTKTLVVPGQRVAEAARNSGFRHIICAANATDTAVIDAICRETL